MGSKTNEGRLCLLTSKHLPLFIMEIEQGFLGMLLGKNLMNTQGIIQLPIISQNR